MWVGITILNICVLNTPKVTVYSTDEDEEFVQLFVLL